MSAGIAPGTGAVEDAGPGEGDHRAPLPSVNPLGQGTTGKSFFCNGPCGVNPS
jgi:hypothetical protein